MTNADWANKDFYKTLGVAKDASAAEIKKAYRSLARDNHPDSHPGNAAAEAKLFDINMLVVAGGRERTEPEYRRLFEQAGLALTRVGGTRSPLSVIVATAI